jgi:hypothetical protein
MKLQDLHPFDSAIVGLNGDFHSVGNDSFFIGSECILATDQIITIGKEYILVNTPTEAGVKMTDVILLDVYYEEGVIHMIVQDIMTQRIFTIDHSLECAENECMLVDLNYFIDRINAENNKSGYGKC